MEEVSLTIEEAAVDPQVLGSEDYSPDMIDSLRLAEKAGFDVHIDMHDWGGPGNVFLNDVVVVPEGLEGDIKAMVWDNRNDGNPMSQILTRSTRHSGWQLSHLDRNGSPWGHSDFGALEPGIFDTMEGISSGDYLRQIMLHDGTVLTRKGSKIIRFNPSVPRAKRNRAERHIHRSRQLWEAYDARGTKKSLMAFGAHIKSMASARSARVRMERMKAARAFNSEMKTHGWSDVRRRNPSADVRAEVANILSSGNGGSASGKVKRLMRENGWELLGAGGSRLVFRADSGSALKVDVGLSDSDPHHGPGEQNKREWQCMESASANALVPRKISRDSAYGWIEVEELRGISRSEFERKTGIEFEDLQEELLALPMYPEDDIRERFQASDDPRVLGFFDALFDLLNRCDADPVELAGIDQWGVNADGAVKVMDLGIDATA